MNETDKFALLHKYHFYLKRMQQLSWDFDRFSRRFSIERVEPDNVDSQIRAYQQFIDQVVALADDWKNNIDIQ